MTWLLSCRALPGGGPVRDVNVLSNPPQLIDTNQAAIAALCRGHDVLIATHGFNVNQQEGIDHLTEWQPLLQLPGGAVYLGFLWPGDSVWLNALVYPSAANTAMQSGDKLAAWLNQNLTGAASVSFVSHSLGARVILQAIKGLASSFRVRRLLLMAGAIDSNCLGEEYAKAAARVEKISVLASSEDDVLKMAFPLGNPISGIFAEGHPFWHAAIGRAGPTENPPTPAQLDLVCKVPNQWNFGHDDYLPPSPVPAGYTSIPYPLPINAPTTDTTPAANTPAGYQTAPNVWEPFWKSAWSAAIASTRFP